MLFLRNVKFKPLGTLFLILCISGVVNAQHIWQKPILRSRTDVEKIMGPIRQKEPSRDLNIVWVWGVDFDHERGYHEHDWVMDLYVNKLLSKVPRVTATHIMYFPSKKQWEKADLVVFYHHAFNTWGKPQYNLIDAFQARGGGLIFIHESLIQRPGGEELAKRVGLAWGTRDSASGRSRWGAMPTPVDVTTKGRRHPILEGFGAKIDIVDEFYWNLTGDQSKIDVLVTSPAGPGGGSTGPPKAEKLDSNKWPVFWTMEKGKGKVFVSNPGHNYFLFNDPYYRIILFRAMAWTMNESFDPFKPLVTEGIELKEE